MPIIDVTKNWIHSYHSAGENGMELSAAYDVLFDDKDDPDAREGLAREATGIPALYSWHSKTEQYPYFYLYHKDIDPTEGPFLFRVICRYKVAEPRYQKEDYGLFTNPLSRPPIISYSAMPTWIPVDKDISGNPILNTVKQKFDPPPMIEAFDLILRIEKNQSSYSSATAAQYIGAVNSDTFFGFLAGKVRCVRFDGVRVTAGNSTYWEVNYEFAIRAYTYNGQENDWKLYIANMGTHLLNAAGTDYVKIKDEEGNYIIEPVAISQNGKSKITPGSTIYYCPFEVYRNIAFEGLGLE